MKITIIILGVLFATILLVPAIIIAACVYLLDLSNITYDLSVGLITGTVTTLLSYYFFNYIPRTRLRKQKYKQYVEIVKRHGSGLAYAYSGGYAAFVTFNNYYCDGEFSHKNLWLMFCRRTTATTSAVERILSLHSEFNTNVALLLDLIPEESVKNLKRANLDFWLNQIMSAYNSIKTHISSNRQKKYDQESYDEEFRLHETIRCYMNAVKSIEDYLSISPRTGVAIFVPISKIEI